MKLRSAIIYGFGKWVDYTIDFSEQSFITIYGENESGKTTLQRFLIFMLFGLPPKQRKHYQPKTSSKMGGLLTIVDSEIGEYTIERLHDVRNGTAKCFTSDGGEYDETWLQEKLHGMNAKTFRSIFSFSAVDLSAIQFMKEEDISDILLGVGLTGSTHIYTIEKRLEQRLADYFKPYGKNPEINQQLERLKQLQHELTTIKQEEATYQEKKNAIMELHVEIKMLQEALQDEKQKQLYFEKVIQALPQIEEYIVYQQQLAEYPQQITIPEEGIERLEYVKDKLLPIKSELTVLQHNQEKFTKEKEALEESIDAFPLEDAKKVTSLLSSNLEHEKDLQRIQNEINRLDMEINNQILSLDIALTMEELEVMNLPFHVEKQWNDLKVNMEEIEREKQLNAEQMQLANSKQKFLEEQLSEIKDNILPVENRKELEALLNRHKEGLLRERLQQEASRNKENWRKTKQKTNSRIKLILGLSILVAIIFVILAVVFKDFLYTNYMVVSLAVGLAQWFWGKKSITDMQNMVIQFPSDAPSSIVSEEEKKHAEMQIHLDQEYTNEMTLLYEQLKEADIQLNQVQEQNILVGQRQVELLEQIDKQKKLYPFLQVLDVRYWPELYHAIKQLIRKSHEKKQLRMEAEQLNHKLDDYKNIVRDFFEKNDVGQASKSTTSQLELLASKRNSLQEKQTQLHHITKLLEDNLQRVEELTVTYDTYEREMTALFDIANVKTEEEFYRKAKTFFEKEKLQVNCEKIKTQFSSFFSPEEWKELVLNKPQHNSMELQNNEVFHTIQQLDRDIDEKRQQLANLKAEIQQLESSDTYSKLVHQFEAEKEKLSELGRKWAIYKTAKELLTETKDSYRDKYLSKVLEKTSQFFSILTENVYINVYAPSKDKPFAVERFDHIRFHVNELSQGTMNQLYVSLRLAVCEVMSESMELPFIIDDAFVHFDPIRTKRVIRLLGEIASNHQVLLFTCNHEGLPEFNSSKPLKLTNAVPILENKW
ncbi:ATP-binding protein [Ornithinibacillus xuwenensis]|uniref:AAA family ATPase n=1 Tax=Ornithinibacillus xuwenensis TaxID=3144668 RepID=A0ABU9XLJ5_9BACI